MADGYIGEIKMFAGNFAPVGWALCDGQQLSISSNQALFSILGTTYGGDGRTTFALPDLRGRVPMHAGHGPGLSNHPLGQKAGEETVTLTEQQIPSHTHVPTVTVNADNTDGSSKDPSNHVWAFHTEDIHAYGTNQNATMAAGAVTVSNANTGGGQDHTNLQPYQVVNYIICLVGTYPSRN